MITNENTQCIILSMHSAVTDKNQIQISKLVMPTIRCKQDHKLQITESQRYNIVVTIKQFNNNKL